VLRTAPFPQQPRDSVPAPDRERQSARQVLLRSQLHHIIPSSFFPRIISLSLFQGQHTAAPCFRTLLSITDRPDPGSASASLPPAAISPGTPHRRAHIRTGTPAVCAATHPRCVPHFPHLPHRPRSFLRG